MEFVALADIVYRRVDFLLVNLCHLFLNVHNFVHIIGELFLIMLFVYVSMENSTLLSVELVEKLKMSELSAGSVFP